MASQFNSNAALPQGFSVYQPALGAHLQFFPALGSQELDDMMNACLPGPAPVKEKRATISLDFLEHVQLTGQTFKFYAVHSLSPVTAAPATSATSASSSFNASLAGPYTWDWSQTPGNASVSSRSSAQSRKSSRAGSSTSSSRHPTTDFSHLPGMKILTKDGQDVTNSASRGSKTKEQRDHAHLMRIIKACDSCRRKKIRCDPSHKKRPAPQSQPQPASKPAKKARTAPQDAPPASIASSSSTVDEALSISPSPLGLDPTFTFTGLEGMDFAAAAQPVDAWEEFVQFPSEDTDENYDFFYDPEGYLSAGSASADSASFSSAASSAVLSPKSLATSSQRESVDVPGLGPEFQTTSPELPGLDQSGSLGYSYTDFTLFSPESSFSPDSDLCSGRMINSASTALSLLQEPSLRPESTLAQGSSGLSSSANVSPGPFYTPELALTSESNFSPGSTTLAPGPSLVSWSTSLVQGMGALIRHAASTSVDAIVDTAVAGINASINAIADENIDSSLSLSRRDVNINPTMSKLSSLLAQWRKRLVLLDESGPSSMLSRGVSRLLSGRGVRLALTAVVMG